MNRAFSGNAHRLVEIEGAAAVVSHLKRMGLRQIAVSNSNRAVVDANLSAVGITGFMEFSLSLDDVCEGKPDPFPYRYACYLLRLDPSEVLAVEDSATGAASARGRLAGGVASCRRRRAVSVGISDFRPFEDTRLDRGSGRHTREG